MNILANQSYRRRVHRRIQFKFVLEEKIFGEHILVVRTMFRQTLNKIWLR